MKFTYSNALSFGAAVVILTPMVTVLSATAGALPDARRTIALVAGVADTACVLPSRPTVVKRDGDAILQFWIMGETEGLFSSDTPMDSAYLDYRRVITSAGADLRRPVADPPQPKTEDERVIWDREFRNAELAFSGSAGTMRPIRCLDALLFAYQNARFSQLTHPTEFVAAILRKPSEDGRTLKIYFAASDEMFPPQEFYGLDQMAGDIEDGWEFWVVLHNHTVQRNGNLPALGVPAPSTSDVDLLRSLARNLGLQSAWVTNGFYTIEVPARALTSYFGRPQ